MVHCLTDPGADASLDSEAVEYWSDGALVVDRGRVAAAGPADDILANVGDQTTVDHYPDAMIVPGLVD